MVRLRFLRTIRSVLQNRKLTSRTPLILQPKIFVKSETVSSRVLASTSHPNKIIYTQTQEYTLRLLGSKRVRLPDNLVPLFLTSLALLQIIKSVILVDLDDEDKIVRLQDQRNGEEPGMAWGVGTLRRLNGRITPWIIRPPKDIRATM